MPDAGAQPRVAAADRGAMIWDAALAQAPTAGWFDREWWRARATGEPVAGGRGGAVFVQTPVGACVLRHYRRGGWMAPLLDDRYVWRGRERTRSFAEFRLLAELHQRGLPVPRPVAARYRRRGIYYTADLVTHTIEHAETLAEVIAAGGLDGTLAECVGTVVARFHTHGVDHADLNAHNILVVASTVWLIDFDRGEIRVTGTAWKLANLARLKRSLLKVGACNHDEAKLDREVWTPLMRGYERGMGVGR